MRRQDKLHMDEPTDPGVHAKKNKAPYPQPAKTTNAGKPASDTADPAESDPKAPHDRGASEDGEHVDAVEDMQKKLRKGG
jgi:hypothetical protein